MENFDEIYRMYFSEVYKFVLALCRDPAVAEEVTQEAFFKALKQIDRFEGKCSISTWLCEIAKNTLFSFNKKNGRQMKLQFDFLASEENLEQRFLDKETAYEIHRALHHLKEPYKEVFWLRTFGELSFFQIGSIFEKTESWARVTYYRAKVMIKEELQ